MLGNSFRGNESESLSCFDLNSNKNYYKSDNEGNFLGLVKLMSTESSDLRKHLELCKQYEDTVQKSRGRGGKVTFLSNSFVNVVLDKIGSRLKSAISRQIGGNKFGLLVDTTTDISSKHQMSIIVRFVKAMCWRGLLFSVRLMIRPVKAYLIKLNRH